MTARRGMRHFWPWLVALVLLLGAATDPMHAQRPILQLRLPGVGQVLVQGRLTSEGMLELPVAPLEKLTGEDLTERPYVSMEALSRILGPQVSLEYDPRHARLVIDDPHASLAATRALYSRQHATARVRPGAFAQSGPYGILTTDLHGGRLIEGGWSFGRFGVHAAHSTESGAWWGLSVRPLPRTYLSYSDGQNRYSRFALRWATGRTFLLTSYAPATGDFRGQIATSLGRWTAFLQEDGSAAITFRGPVHVTVARTSHRYSMRLSYGRNLSPFTIPRVR